jgi:hypothetical protein
MDVAQTRLAVAAVGVFAQRELLVCMSEFVQRMVQMRMIGIFPVFFAQVALGRLAFFVVADVREHNLNLFDGRMDGVQCPLLYGRFANKPHSISKRRIEVAEVVRRHAKFNQDNRLCADG